LIYWITGFTFSNKKAKLSESMEEHWLWQFLGRLHPVVVHFPIGLLLFAVLLELLTIRRFHSPYRTGIRALVLGGSVSAVFAAFFGYLMMSNENVAGDLLDTHQLWGIVTAALSLLLLLFHQKAIQNPARLNILTFRLLLFLTGTGVISAGHLGASLTHGEDFLVSVIRTEPNKKFDFESFHQISLNSENQEIELIGQVRMVFANHCYKCHSGAKTEGGLRLDEKELLFKGGESGPVVIVANPEASELIRRIRLPKNHKEAMPAKGQRLSKDEITLLTYWVENGAVWPDGAATPSLYRVAALAPRDPVLPPPGPGLAHPIDRWVDQYFQQKGVKWQPLVDDRTYLRRIYLDVIGILPDYKTYEAFAQDNDPHKRDKWLKKLLNRSDDYAQHWLTFWNDALRNDYTGTGYITRGRYNITDWLYEALVNNMPYDQFVKKLISPDERSRGFIAGIQWRGTVNASQRTEMQAAQNVGQVFLGLNLKCASCHDSFISDWKLDQAYAFANIFADSTLQINRCDQPTGKYAKTAILWEELGEIDSLSGKAEKLRQLSENLVQPANGRLYRTIVNRIWKQLMGRGLVEPVDEMDNEPWSQDLLDWLAADFAASGHDVKALIYLIASSNAYQLPSDAIASAEYLKAQDYIFKGMVKRRLGAEQFADALSALINPVFEEKEMKYNPGQLKPHENQPEHFIRASLVANNSFLASLGRPSREVVSTGRDNQASLLQALELSNGITLNQVVQNGSQRWWAANPNPDLLVERLYNEILLRKPNKKEMAAAISYLNQDYCPEKVQDLLWAMVLLPEFQLID
jgi:uncharacterized membrane protein/mono/diheme cytochrome c family protein